MPKESSVEIKFKEGVAILFDENKNRIGFFYIRTSGFHKILELLKIPYQEDVN
jgi:hypothetical protein